jgi:hypothetical protein
VGLVGLLVAVALGVLVGTRPRAPGLETAPPPAPEETPTTGPTALPSGLREQARWVSYAPQADLRLPRLARAAAGRSFAFEVLPFEQDTSGTVAGGFQVERGGESVAAAIALQLERGGFPVGVRTARAPGLPEDRFRIDLDLFVLTATLSGKVRFTVSHAPQAGGGAPLAMAVLESSVTLTATNGRLLYMRRIRETEAAGDALGNVSERERAARAVLHKWVRTLFGDARLESALVGYVSQDNEGRR